MNKITMLEIRKFLNSIQKIAVRPAAVTHRDLMLAPTLFQKLMNDRTNGAIQIQILVDGKPVNFEVDNV